MKKINGHGPLRHGAAEEFLPGNAGNDGSAKPATQIRHGAASKIDGVVDDGLGCRSAHPDTGAGGQHGGDVSHQPPPQRIEVRVSLVSLVAGLFRVSFGWDMALSEQGAHCSAWCCFGKRRVETASMDTLSIYE